MSQAAQLAERIIVCHREPGYLRLQLPAELCTTDLAADLEAGMKTLAGIGSAALGVLAAGDEQYALAAALVGQVLRQADALVLR